LQETVCKCVILNAHNSNNSVTQLTTIRYGKKTLVRYSAHLQILYRGLHTASADKQMVF